MKDRNWFCYSLDMLGMALVLAALFSLLGARWMSGATLELTLLTTFRIALMGAVGAFLSARSLEILRLLREEKSTTATPVVESYATDNVEQLPKRHNLPRAA